MAATPRKVGIGQDSLDNEGHEEEDAPMQSITNPSERTS